MLASLNLDHINVLVFLHENFESLAFRSVNCVLKCTLQLRPELVCFRALQFST
jgi:hypothetical protein